MAWRMCRTRPAIPGCWLRAARQSVISLARPATNGRGTNTFTFGGFTGSGASGGGISALFPQPGYQVDAGVPVSVNDGHRGRGVPDVSANASPNSGYPIILGGAPSLFPANGTSASAPLWAGLIAVLNAAIGENIGFINPVIYALNGTGFRDILPEPGAADNSFAGVTGYPVTPGWDAVTGWAPSRVSRC